MSAAIQLDVALDSSWRVTRDGDHVLTVAIHQEQGEIVVATGVNGSIRPYRFDSLQAADSFVTDLMTSFSYLGCEVTPDQAS